MTSERKSSSAEATKAGRTPGAGGNVPQSAGSTTSPKEAATSTTREESKKATTEANKGGEAKSGEANPQAKQK